jgi:hypothetical protein
MDDNHTVSNWVGNVVSGAAIGASWIGMIPTVMTVIASSVALVWYLIQIYESATVQRRIAQRRVRKLAHLKARVILMEAQGRPALPGPGD